MRNSTVKLIVISLVVSLVVASIFIGIQYIWMTKRIEEASKSFGLYDREQMFKGVDLKTYNKDDVIGLEAKKMINEIRDKDVAVLVWTQEWGNYADDSQFDSLNLVEVSERNDTETYKRFINYGRLLKSDKVVFDKEIEAYLTIGGLKYTSEGIIIDVGVEDLNNEESSSYINDSSKYSVRAITEDKSPMIGLVVEELRER